MTYTPKTKEWFIERIGRRVFRDSTGVRCCDKCADIIENGTIITDEDHADYLYNIDIEFAQGGSYLNYRDVK